MKNPNGYHFQIVVLVISGVLLLPTQFAQASGLAGPGATSTPQTQTQSATDLEPGSAQVIQPEDLFKILQSRAEKPLILSVGPHLLYMQAHIPGAEYIGAGSDSQGIDSLRRRVKSLPRKTFIVLYCGCCPWSHCPNVRPAYNELHKAGFTNVKVLYIADNFGADWVDKGYPTIKGQ
ncbi:MAG: rhodanese-like domain-containing protein [Candidatus Korobacteraceae bacterium]